MRLIFVHGWSVTNTDTYGQLPTHLAELAGSFQLDLDIQHIHLGKYVSFHDEVSLDDIARAFNQALLDLSSDQNSIEPFSCITHSTGGPVVRCWIDRFYGADHLDQLPLKHLVMLAPANHGSSLAKLGKERVGRIKAWFSGVEPGEGVLNWLALGSAGQWDLNRKFLDYQCVENGFYPFVLIGQGIDKHFYDFINGYLVEPGSDGVVRVAGANLNTRFMTLEQTDHKVTGRRRNSCELKVVGSPAVRTAEPTAIGVFSSYSHSGSRMGIMAAKNSSQHTEEIVKTILYCLSVENTAAYQQQSNFLQDLTRHQQSLVSKGKGLVLSHFSILVFQVRDDQGHILHHDDYDIFLLAGKKYSPSVLPKGFFVDRQLNEQSHCLVFYLDCKKMHEIKDGLFGVRVSARPDEGFSCYMRGEYQSKGLPIEEVLAPNQTTYIEIVLKRRVDRNVFRFTSAAKGKENFRKIKPSGDFIDE